MIGFTKQEKRFIVFLLFSFLLGFGVNYARKSQFAASHEDWQAEHDRIMGVFQERSSQVEENKNDFPVQPNRPKEERRRALTGKININTAGPDDLQTLPRVGPATAQKIIEYRERKGPFRSIEEIKNVKGIGQKTFEKIKANITVG
jgi:comEA protein